MLYTDKLETESIIVRAALEELYKAASNNQRHPNDMLLVLHNACIFEGKPQIGGDSDWQWQDSFNYIHRLASTITFDSSVIIPEDVIKESISLEQFAYLKFWEADLILKTFYQLSNLVLGKSYDWEFNITKQTNRSELIRITIRDSLKSITPNFYTLIKETYKPQIRNAIAHSLFYFLGNSIVLCNYGHNKGDNLKSISFEEWEKLSHKTFTMFNELIKIWYVLENEYSQKALQEPNSSLNLSISRKVIVNNTLTYKFYQKLDRWGPP